MTCSQSAIKKVQRNDNIAKLFISGCSNYLIVVADTLIYKANILPLFVLGIAYYYSKLSNIIQTQGQTQRFIFLLFNTAFLCG